MATLVRHSGIVVGVDGSAPSRVAAVWAAREASMRNVALTLVHLVPTGAVTSAALAWSAASTLTELQQEQEDEGHRIIAEAVEIVIAELGEGAEVNSELLYSPPVPALVELSKQARMVVPRTRCGRPLSALVGQHRRSAPRALPGRSDPRRRDIGATKHAAGRGRYRRITDIRAGRRDRFRRSLLARSGFGGHTRLQRCSDVGPARQGFVRSAIPRRGDAGRASCRISGTLSRGGGPAPGRLGAARLVICSINPSRPNSSLSAATAAAA